MSTSETYACYNDKSYLSYFQERTTCYYYEFLNLYRENIVASPLASKEWNTLEAIWNKRFSA
ncbi:10871_t:CDS:2, partial [Ambispora gerdemannii]